MTRDAARQVSFASEALILVDNNDRAIGSLRKDDVHDGEGILHRAFSVFLFDDDGAVLLQQRAAGKRLWPGFWSNSCCSHPRLGETIEGAAARRVEQELGLAADLSFIYKFRYHARYGELGSERELCSVFVGRTSDSPLVNPNEVQEWRFVAPAALSDELAATPDRFTPWFRMEWAALCSEYRDAVARACAVQLPP